MINQVLFTRSQTQHATRLCCYSASICILHNISLVRLIGLRRSPRVCYGRKAPYCLPRLTGGGKIIKKKKKKKGDIVYSAKPSQKLEHKPNWILHIQQQGGPQHWKPHPRILEIVEKSLSLSLSRYYTPPHTLLMYNVDRRRQHSILYLYK